MDCLRLIDLGFLHGLRREQPDPSGEEFLHHTLLELVGFGQLGFQRGDLGVHVGEDGGDGGLFEKRG